MYFNHLALLACLLTTHHTQTRIPPRTAAATVQCIRVTHPLAHIPGFSQKLSLVDANANTPRAKGHVYELAKAGDIEREDTHERVLCFSHTMQHPTKNKRREFDIVTTHRWIECKNIAWRNKITTQLAQQFLDQKEIVDRYNKEYLTNIVYEVHSCQAIPPKWRQWFAQHGINCVDDTDLT